MQSRKEPEDSIFNYQNWPIRRQLMISFLCTTLLLQLIIICVIFKINLSFMKSDTNSSVERKVFDRSSSEFQNIAFEIGHSYQAHNFQLSSQLMAFKEMFNLFTSDDSPYANLKTSFKLCSDSVITDYTQACLHISPTSRWQQSSDFDQPTNDMLSQLQNYNVVLPVFMTNFLRKSIQKLCLTLQLETDQFIASIIYPAQKVDMTFEPMSLDAFYQSGKRSNQIVLGGPYIDLMNNQNQQVYMSLSYSTSYKKNIGSSISTTQTYNLFFQLTYLTSSISQLFSELNYLTSAEVVVTNSNQTIIYAPSFWLTNNKKILVKIYDLPQYSGFTQFQNFTSVNLMQLEDKQFQDGLATAECVQIPYDGYYASSDLKSFIPTSSSLANQTITNNTGIYVFLYGRKDEMLLIYTLISTIISHEDTVIILLTLCSCINTIAIVFIFTYMVAVKISRPLRKLITTAANMSRSATQKNVTQQILQELDQIDAKNQIADLIEAFKNLVRTIDQRNNTQKSTAKSQVIQYPLNQYDPEFISKTKGESDINWRNVIEEIDS